MKRLLASCFGPGCLPIAPGLRRGSFTVVPEHILLGLVKEDSGVGVMVLKNLDIDITRISQVVGDKRS